MSQRGHRQGDAKGATPGPICKRPSPLDHFKERDPESPPVTESPPVKFSDARLSKAKKRIAELLARPLYQVAFTLMQMEGHRSVPPLDELRAHGARLINAENATAEEKAQALKTLDEEIRNAGKSSAVRRVGRPNGMPANIVVRAAKLVERSGATPAQAAGIVLAYEEEDWALLGTNRDAVVERLTKAVRDHLRKPARDAARERQERAALKDAQAATALSDAWPPKPTGPKVARNGAAKGKARSKRTPASD